MIAAALSLVLAAAAPAPQRTDSLGADWGQQQDQARQAVRSGRLLPLNRVIAGVQRRVPGRLLDAGIETDPDGRAVYHIRWAATDGRRLDVFADAASGAILRQEGR